MTKETLKKCINLLKGNWKCQQKNIEGLKEAIKESADKEDREELKEIAEEGEAELQEIQELIYCLNTEYLKLC